MAQFDNLPYVFELARIEKNKCGSEKFSLKYEEYSTYVKKFEALSDEERTRIVCAVKERKKGPKVDAKSGFAGASIRIRDGLSFLNKKKNV